MGENSSGIVLYGKLYSLLPTSRESPNTPPTTAKLHTMLPRILLLSLFSAFTPWTLAQNATTPSPPGLTFLYTLNCTLGTVLDIGYGPRGHRVAIPITGGYFKGPRLSGEIALFTPDLPTPPGQCGMEQVAVQAGGRGFSQLTLHAGTVSDLGADWGITDNSTGIFSADTRYNLVTDDGANIFIQTSGPQQPDGHLHLREVFETGHPAYYWLNNIVAVGILTSGDGWVSIDSWQLESPAA